MPILTLRFKDKKTREFLISIGQSCTIGRKTTNIAVIDNLTVSGFHATNLQRGPISLSGYTYEGAGQHRKYHFGNIYSTGFSAELRAGNAI